MQPIFTMQYGEFAVADYLSKKIKNVSVFIPASAQEKGIVKFSISQSIFSTLHK